MTTTPFPGNPSQAPAPQVHRNGIGTAGLVLALVGTAIAILPFVGAFGVVCGVTAVVFGIIGLGRVRRGVATNKGQALVGVLAGVLAVVVGITTTAVGVSAVNRVVQGSAPKVAGAAAQPAPPGNDGSMTAGFGQTLTYPDGLAVSVAVRPFQPAASAAGTGQGVARCIAARVTLTNNTSKPIEALSTSVVATANGAPLSQVVDIEQNMTGAPMVTVLPGKTVTFEMAFGVPTAGKADLQVETRPNFGMGYQTAIFSGEA